METPAENWRDAIPLGDGSLGALVYGRIAHELILLNHERLFSPGKTPPLPETAAELPIVRRMLAESRFEEANGHLSRIWAERGYHAETGRYLPGPQIVLRQTPNSPFRSYARQLDFSTGVASTIWTDAEASWRREALVSRDAGVFALFCENDVATNWTVRLEPQTFLECTDDAGRQIPLEIEVDRWIHQEGLGADFHGPFGTSCTVAVRLVTDGKVIVSESETSVQSARHFLLLAVLRPRRLPSDSRTEIIEQLRAAPSNWDDLVTRHTRIHTPLYHRSRLKLSSRHDRSNDRLLAEAYQGRLANLLTARLVNYGRYLLIASTAPGTLPPNLQGIWNGNYNPPWWGAFFFNENMQMSLWPALPGGLPHAVQTLFDLLEAHLDDFRLNAKKIFGCRGILPPLYMTPDSGLKKNPAAHVLHWTGSGAWLAQTYFDYWLFTGDAEFALRRALPFLEEVAAFYEDFLVVGDDGWLHSSPANSPENHPLGQTSVSGRELRICSDPTMDFALIKELLENLLTLTEAIGVTHPARTRWQTMLRRIPPYRINEDGAIAEWIDPRFRDNYHHRHLSHLYPLFPGFEVTAESTPELHTACKVALERRKVIGIQSQTGWSLTHMANIAARLGDPSESLDAIRMLACSTVGINLFTYHNDLRGMGITCEILKGNRPAFQIEANMGITAAVYEMLVQSRSGLIRMFPALPREWKQGHLSGVWTRTGVSLDLTWDWTKQTWEVLMHASRPATCHLHLPPSWTLAPHPAVTQAGGPPLLTLSAGSEILLRGQTPD